jgi:ferredoxin
MKVKVDKDLCLGCGICPDICPEVFEMEDDGKAVTKIDEIPPEAENSCRDAAQQCPAEAIKIQDK